MLTKRANALGRRQTASQAARRKAGRTGRAVMEGLEGRVLLSESGSTAFIAANSAPSLSNANKTTQLGAILSLTPTDFTSHFSDADGDSLQTVKITSLPRCGVLRLAGELVGADEEIPATLLAQLTYTPLTADSGTASDSFGWNASDGDLYASTSATMDVTIAAPVFASSVSYATNFNWVKGVCVGDFTNDGSQDLAAFADGGITVLLNNGDGSFATTASFPLGYAAADICASDFNNDGGQDLVAVYVARDLSEHVAVLLGNGDGTFTLKADYPTGGDGTGVSVADFNCDGRQDLAISHSSLAGTTGGSLSILLGNGDGTFIARPDLAVGHAASRASVGDFNGDGKPDLAVVNGGGDADGSVTILLGNGDGSFEERADYAMGWCPSHTAVGDLNGDGSLDLVVGNMDGLNVLLGNGDGTFSPAGYVFVGTNGVSIGDFNGDGKPDLATACADNVGVRVFPGNGDGTFGAGLAYGEGLLGVGLCVGDFSGNGNVDLALPNGWFNTVSVFLNSYPPRAVYSGAREDNITIDYTLRDSHPGFCNILVQYSIDDGRTWATATPGSGGDGTADLASSVTGVSHRFTWGSAYDVGLVVLSAVRLRIIPDSATALPVMTEPFRVYNWPNYMPTATVTLDSCSPKGADVLIATATKSDVDGEHVSLTYVWKVNGLVKRTFTSPVAMRDTFDLAVQGHGKAGDVVSVEVTPDDGTASGATVSDSATIATDQAPTVTASLSSHSPFRSDTLTVTATKWDVDGDPVALTFVWSVNGVVKRTFTSSTALTDSFSLSGDVSAGNGDVVTVEVTPSDGLVSGPAATDTATVSQAAPTAVLVYSSNPEIHYGEVLKASILVTIPGVDGPLPTGTITLKEDDGTVLKTVALVNGQATVSLSGLARGYHWITASYSGDGSYNALTSAAPLSVHVGASHVVDILALYTSGAAAQVSNVRDAIYQAVATTNDVLLNSRIDLSLELVDVALTSYHESGFYETDLTRLQKSGDGYLDDALSLRAKYGADLVCLFVGQAESDNTIGLGYVLDGLSVANAIWGFSEVDIETADAPDYTLAHELGHNFGAAHDRAHADSTGLYSDSYGYRYKGSDGRYYHDIMSYDSSAYDTTIPYYSNPAIIYKGAAAGKTGYSNVARTINASAPVVAQYEPTKVPLVTPTQTTVSLQGEAYSNLPLTISAKVKGLLANPHTPTGSVTFLDGDVALGTVKVSGGAASWTGTLPQASSHSIRALYQNDDYFGDSLSAPVSGSRVFSIAENSAAGMAVGAAAMVNSGYSYSITAGNGAGAFAINASTGAIRVANRALLNYEQTKAFRLTVRATKNGAPTVFGDAAITINLTNVNEPPGGVAISGQTVSENRAAGAVVGRLSASDPDSGNTFTYSLVSGNGSLLAADNAAFTIVRTSSGSVLETKAPLNFERQASYHLMVRVKDQGGLYCDRPVTINVKDVNEAPTSVKLTTAGAAMTVQSGAAGALVGTLSAVDPDAGSSFTYTLLSTSGAGSAGFDSARFVVSGNSLLVGGTGLTYRHGQSYDILVRVTDQGGLYRDAALVLAAA